jgi:hypothetical protein
MPACSTLPEEVFARVLARIPQFQTFADSLEALGIASHPGLRGAVRAVTVTDDGFMVENAQDTVERYRRSGLQ